MEWCVACEAGHEPSRDDGTCIACENGEWNTDGKTCQNSTAVDFCHTYWTTQDRCELCDGELKVSFDNKCRQCENGETSTTSECLKCPEGQYSIFGKTECTSECGMFDGDSAACMDSGFCKVNAFGKCVGNDDNTVLIVGLGVGIPLFFIILIIIVIAVLIKIGWCARRKAAKRAKEETKLMAEMEMVAFATDNITIDITPSTLSFGGQAPPAEEEVTDTFQIVNNDNFKVCFVVHVPESREFDIGATPLMGEVEGQSCADVDVRLKRHGIEPVSTAIDVKIYEKKNTSNGSTFTVPVRVVGRTAFDLVMKELSIGDKIGEGSFGAVYEGKYLNNTVAVKMLVKMEEQHVATFKREVEMLKTVRGQNVVVFYGAVMEGEKLCHVTELMDLGTLESVLRKERLTPQLKVKVMRDVGVGMRTVHSFNVTHRDLKPENVLCKSPLDVSNEELCKITDFGTSRGVEGDASMTMTKGQGTPLYMAPEMLLGKKRYNKAVDVYSYGILCSVVWNDGRTPYAEYSFANALELQNAVVQGCRPFVEDCPGALVEMMEKCWSANVSDRPPFDAIVNHIEAFVSEMM